MTLSKPFFTTLATVLAVSACQTTTEPATVAAAPEPKPELTLEPVQETVSILEVRDEYLLAHPEALSLKLVDEKGRGFTVFPNGGTYHHTEGASAGPRTIPVEITAVNGSEVCVGKYGSWTGGCTTLLPAPDGSYKMHIAFGNGHETVWHVRIKE